MSLAVGSVTPVWLRLREPADAAARSAELAARVAALLPPGPVVIHDLGAGSGSMGRWLAPRLRRPQHWVVHDRDEALLELAVADPPGGAAVTVEARRSDITRLEPADLAGTDLVVASALLDLLTAGELARMLGACPACPILLALSVAGRVAFTPADPLDAALAAAFDRHQRRAGRLGPDAVATALELLGEVVLRPSPWRLEAAHAALTAAWLDGWIAAACEQEPALGDAAAAYRDRRLAQLAAGRLRVRVEHVDLLVLP